jgi:hypothetical protein
MDKHIASFGNRSSELASKSRKTPPVHRSTIHITQNASGRECDICTGWLNGRSERSGDSWRNRASPLDQFGEMDSFDSQNGNSSDSRIYIIICTLTCDARTERTKLNAQLRLPWRLHAVTFSTISRCNVMMIIKINTYL